MCCMSIPVYNVDVNCTNKWFFLNDFVFVHYNIQSVSMLSVVISVWHGYSRVLCQLLLFNLEQDFKSKYISVESQFGKEKSAVMSSK